MHKMAYKSHLYPKKSEKTSKLVLLAALVIALIIPFFLVKMFRDKPKHFTNQLSLPEKVAPSKLEPIEEEEKEESEWEIITAHSGDTLASIFKRVGLSGKTLQNLLHNNPHAKLLTSIKTNQQLEFLVRDETLEKLVVPISATQYLLITGNEEGTKFSTELKSRKTNNHNQYATATVTGSLYSTAKRMNIPYKLVRQMTEIFKWEIDFSREVRAGDKFTIVYKASFIESNLVGTGDIIAVTYTSKDKTHQAFRHVNADGDYDYFNIEGKSLRKAFTRYPIQFSHISSTFSLSRKHPILHYNRPHKGVDLAASLGTPIRATGDGKIATIGRHSGYGNMIKITHDQTYSSVYGHMLKFQKGLSRGDRIKRGQIIGYVGQSGLATGPHCHYEFHVNHQPRNPSTIELPHASPISKREIASFKANTSTLLAQMKLFEEAKIAASGQKPSNKG